MSLSPNVGDLRLILDSTRWTPHCGTVSGTWIPQEKIFWIPLPGAKCFARRNILKAWSPGNFNCSFSLQWEHRMWYKGSQWLMGFANSEQRRKNRTKKIMRSDVTRRTSVVSQWKLWIIYIRYLAISENGVAVLEFYSSKNMKLTVRKSLWLLGFLTLFYYTYRNLQAPSMVSRAGNRPVNCEKSAKEIQQLVHLAHGVHKVLDELGIKHWLMFGSLWGIQRKLYNPLPWDDDVDMGLSGDDVHYQSLSREKFLSAFTTKGFTLKERLDRNGIVGIFNQKICPSGWVDIFIFYDYRGTMKRTGWETWLAPINYNLYSSFSSRAVEGSLPKARFGDFDMYVPKDILLVLKSVYPFNWWVEDRPRNCINKKIWKWINSSFLLDQNLQRIRNAQYHNWRKDYKDAILGKTFW